MHVSYSTKQPLRTLSRNGYEPELVYHPQVVYKCMSMSVDNITSVVMCGRNIKSEASVSPSLVSMTCLQNVTQPSLRTCHEFFLAFV